MTKIAEESLSRLRQPILIRLTTFPVPSLGSTHFFVFVASGCLAFAPWFPFLTNRGAYRTVVLALSVWLVVKPVVFWLAQLNRGKLHLVSFNDIVGLLAGNLLAALISAGPLLLLEPSTFPRGVILVDLMVSLHLTIGVRMIARGFWSYVRRCELDGAERILIYGAGHAGNMLLREIRSNSRLQYHVCGFIDDDPQKHKMLIQGVRVLASGNRLAAIAIEQSVASVLIAVPSVNPSAMLKILERCRAANLPCKTIPCMADILEGRALAPQIRPVAVEDLLGRTQVRLDDTAILAKLENAVVLVTGAAGSIGSEVCRQVARFRPKAIIGFDMAETPLFNLDREFREEFPQVTFFAEIGTIGEISHLEHVFERYGPSIVYHAAAYKHVPVMEFAVNIAVENNVLGTANVATTAQRFGVADFVMISSDKAVKPTNIMGLSKRIAELVVASLQNSTTKFVSVRFGNVLESNGSVIPIFKNQIAMRRPVTVTHPEVTRFFMTIPEAAQLVLQASTMSKGGEIFVLDMGQPVKIADLARNLILLSGLQPGEDIPIRFTGLRPGEKLFEELHLLHENVLPTYHDKIRIFSGPVVGFEEMQDFLARIRRLCTLRNERGLISELRTLVPEYTPSDYVFQRTRMPDNTTDLVALHNGLDRSVAVLKTAPVVN